MASRDVLVRLRANISEFRAAMDQAQNSVKGVGDKTEQSSQQANTALGRMAQSAQKHSDAWDTAGTALAGFGAVTVAALGATVKAAIDWESAWAGVTKTVDGSASEMATLEGELRGLARTLPSTHSEIAAVAEAAGQLGVKRQDIAAFTKTMIDLGQTTNLTADEAATSLAQMMNVMGTAPQNVGRLGASLVALGNAGASTEAEILSMAQRISGAGALVGASESDVLALSNAMASMGINAELGGGVMTRVLNRIYAATKEGGDALQGFADVAGMSGQEFAAAFEADPVRAVDAFVQGLNRVESSGGNVISTLSDLGMKGTEETSVLLQLKGAGDLLAESLDLGNKSWQENTALVEEAAKRYDTTASKLAIARNNIYDAAIEIGETFLPVLADMAGGLADVAGWFAQLPAPVQATAGGLAGVAGVAGLAAGAFLLVFPRVIETYKAFQTLNTTMPGVASGMRSLGIAAGVAAGMATLGVAVSALDAALAPTPMTMEQVTASLLDMDGSIASVDASVRGLGQGTTTELNTFADVVSRVANPGVTERLNDFGGSLFNVVTLGTSDTGDGAASRRRSLEFLQGLDQSLALMVESGNADMAAEKFRVLTAEAEANGVSVNQLKELFPGYQDALKGVENDQRLAAESAAEMAGSTGAAGTAVAALPASVESVYGSLAAYAAAMGMSEDATEALIEEANKLGETMVGFVDPLGTYTGYLNAKIAKEQEAAGQTDATSQAGQEAWRRFVDGAGIAFDQYLADLEKQVEDQRNWQTNMLILAGRVSQGTLDELARMGPEGAPLVADLVNRSDDELDRFDNVTYQRSKEATDAWGQQLRLAAPVLAAIGRTAGQGVVDELARKLADGTVTVAEIARQYGINLANGINPILGGLGKGRIDVRQMQQRAGRGLYAADGGLVDFYADGGVESHVAQIAPAGAWRVWAEPETGGEAYIPLSPAKRSRSLDIWRETGRRLDAPEAQYFASGGFTDPDDVPRPRSTAPFQWPISTPADATMQAGYEATVAWLRDNAELLFGAVPGSGGGLAGGSGRVAQLFNTVKRAFPEARLNSGYRPGDSGFHGRGMAVDLGWMRMPGGIGNSYMAAMNRWIYDTFGAQTKELIYNGLGDDRPNLKNGRPLAYSRATQLQHRNHVHWAMAKGGILNPHVRDTGGPLLPGFTFNGTGAPETVIPNHVVDAAVRAGGSVAPPNVTVHARVFVGDREITDIARVEAQAVVAGRDEQLARNVRSAWS